MPISNAEPTYEEHGGDWESYRAAMNLWKIQSDDPATEAILATSNHATVYQVTPNGGWEKQKIEGATFVIKRYVLPLLLAGSKREILTTDRNKSPPFAIYVMNKMSLSDFLLPLIPGEMKISLSGPGFLQIARRGDSASSPLMKLCKEQGRC